MNILYICSKDPRTLTGGNEQRTNLLWESLKTMGNVYTIVYSGDKEPIKIPGEHPITICSTHYKDYYKSAKGIFYTFLEEILGFAYLPYKYPLKYKPLELYPSIKFDIVVTRYIHLSAKYHFWDIAPLYVDIDDHPIQVYETTRRDSHPKYLQPLFRSILMFQYRKLLDKIAGGWVANKEQVSKASPKVFYLPNIPNSPRKDYNSKSNQREYLFTIGMMSYPPNYLGVDKFLKEIWLGFHKKYPNVKYKIGGKGAPEEYVNKWSNIEGVEYCGFIEDLNAAYENSLATIVPIYSGGGTCIKTLESLAYSRACISTRFGVRGIENKDVIAENGLFVFENADMFIKAYETIIEDNINLIGEKACNFILRSGFSYNNFKNIVYSVIHH